MILLKECRKSANASSKTRIMEVFPEEGEEGQPEITRDGARVRWQELHPGGALPNSYSAGFSN